MIKKHLSVWFWGCQTISTKCLGRNCRHFHGCSNQIGLWPKALLSRFWATDQVAVAISIWTLTGPLMVPDARRSPGLRLHPLIEWWASCCFIVQYMCCKREEEAKAMKGKPLACLCTRYCILWMMLVRLSLKKFPYLTFSSIKITSTATRCYIFNSYCGPADCFLNDDKELLCAYKIQTLTCNLVP